MGLFVSIKKLLKKKEDNEEKVLLEGLSKDSKKSVSTEPVPETEPEPESQPDPEQKTDTENQ